MIAGLPRAADLATDFLMRTQLALCCLFLFSASALAADANQAVTTDQPVKRFAPRRVIAPTISETRAIVMPDGSLSLMCVDKPNPKVAAQLQKARMPAADPSQNP